MRKSERGSPPAPRSNSLEAITFMIQARKSGCAYPGKTTDLTVAIN